MQIGFDENHLLTIKDSSLPEFKTYQYQLSGYTFSSFDKWIFVYHKKNWKLIQLKNLGDGMQVVYCKNKESSVFHLELKMLEQALTIFEGFDEEKGEKYYFLPSFSKDLFILQEKLEKVNIKIKIEKKQGGTFIYGINISKKSPETQNERLSFLFGLLLLYGKFEKKDTQIEGIKIHLPFINNAYHWYEILEKGLSELQNEGILTKWGRSINGENKIFQISSKSPTLLHFFLNGWNNLLLDQEALLSLDTFERKQNKIKDQLSLFLNRIEFNDYEGIIKLRNNILHSPLQFLK